MGGAGQRYLELNLYPGPGPHLQSWKWLDTSVGHKGYSPSHLSGFSLWFCLSFFPQFLEEEDTTERQESRAGEQMGLCLGLFALSSW